MSRPTMRRAAASIPNVAQSSLESDSSDNGQAIDQAAPRQADAGLSPSELAYLRGSIAALGARPSRRWPIYSARAMPSWPAR